jgi:tmRNA-binding protein
LTTRLASRSASRALSAARFAKGKKTFEKRAADKAREADLEANRVVKSQKFGDY